MLTEQVQLEAHRQLLRSSISNIVLFEQRSTAGRRPYIHPLRPLDGQGVLTEDSPDHHPWQHGIYTGLHGVNGSDFWLDQGEATGRIEPQAPVLHDGNTWTIQSLWRHHHGHGLFDEKQNWSLRFFDGAYALDLTWSLTALCDISVDQCTYGGLFIRMPYTAEKQSRVCNSAGQEGGACEQAAAAWVALHMDIDGRSDGAGIALMNHPQNQDGEALWRVDHQRGINPSPCIAAPVQFMKDEERCWRYRILVFSGALIKTQIETVYTDFSEVS